MYLRKTADRLGALQQMHFNRNRMGVAAHMADVTECQKGAFGRGLAPKHDFAVAMWAQSCAWMGERGGGS